MRVYSVLQNQKIISFVFKLMTRTTKSRCWCCNFVAVVKQECLVWSSILSQYFVLQYFVLASVTIHKSRGSLYLEALSAQFGQKSPIVMSSHGTLPSITTDALGLIPRTFLFLQHQDRHPGLPRMQTDKAMVINFSSPQTRKPDGEAIIPGTFHIDIPGWGQKL